jgi:hypothetical protein
MRSGSVSSVLVVVRDRTGCGPPIAIDGGQDVPKVCPKMTLERHIPEG